MHVNKLFGNNMARGVLALMMVLLIVLLLLLMMLAMMIVLMMMMMADRNGVLVVISQRIEAFCPHLVPLPRSFIPFLRFYSSMMTAMTAMIAMMTMIMMMTMMMTMSAGCERCLRLCSPGPHHEQQDGGSSIRNQYLSFPSPIPSFPLLPPPYQYFSPFPPLLLLLSLFSLLPLSFRNFSRQTTKCLRESNTTPKA